ncbi:MAG: hypothetical protein ACQETE_08620 [Bacteroidota bacterium]
MKHSIIKTSLFTLCLSLVLGLTTTTSWAQITDTTGTATGERGALRAYKLDVRTIAMADATVADPTRLTAININPGALAFVRNFNTLHVNGYQNWNNNLVQTNLTLPVLRKNRHNLAAQVAYQTPAFNKLNLLGNNPQPEPDVQMYQMDLTYAYSFENVVSIGVMNSVTYAQNEFAHYWTYFANIGVLYAPTESLSYGIAFRGLGRSVVYEIIEDGRTTLSSQNLRESLELGATLQYPVDSDYTYMSFSLANEKRFGEDGIWYKAGLEIKAWQLLALRSGIMFQLSEDIYAPRFGMGINTKVVTLDYAFSYRQTLYERYHQVGLTIHF